MSKKVYVVMADVNNMQSYEDFSHVSFLLHSFTKKEDAVEFIKTYDKFVDQEYILGCLSCDAAEIPFEEQRLRDIYRDVFDPESETRTVVGDIKRLSDYVKFGTIVNNRIVAGTCYHLHIDEIEQD